MNVRGEGWQEEGGLSIKMCSVLYSKSSFLSNAEFKWLRLRLKHLFKCLSFIYKAPFVYKEKHAVVEIFIESQLGSSYY